MTDVSAPLPEPVELEELAYSIMELLGNDLTSEAVVRFSRLRPPDQADLLGRMDKDSQAKVLDLLTPKSVGLIIEELEPLEAIELSEEFNTEQLSLVLDETSPDVAADILRGISVDLAIETLEQMQEAEDVAPLMEYDDDDAGGLMTPEFIALRGNMTVSRAIEFVRFWAEKEDLDSSQISHLFVVETDGTLKGRIRLAQLVLAQPHQRISLMMEDEIISVTAETDQEECARLTKRYDIDKLPVIDDGGKLIGVIELDDMVDVFEEEATEDMYKMIGLDEDEKVLGPYWKSVRNRLPWLTVNLGTAVFAGFVVGLFEPTMARVAALAAFLPVIAGQGGIAGTQTLTLVVRSFALGEIGTINARRLIFKELRLSALHGLFLGFLVGAIAYLWKGSEYLALVIGVAMTLNMVIAGLGGVLVPLGFKALRVDPALASAVAVTTLTDVLGFLIYLGLATLAIGLIANSL